MSGVNGRRGLILVGIAAILFAAVQIWIGVWRYEIYRAGVDAGIFTQVALSAGGCFCAAAEGRQNHLLVHFSPALVAAYPFVKIFGDARGLVVLQAIAISLTAFPLYAIARLYVDEYRAAGIAAAAMLYPVLWAQTFTDFHENAFVPVLSATLAWSVAARRTRFGIAAAVLLLLVKEDQSVLLAMNGVLIALLWRRDRDLVRMGSIVAALAVLCGVAYFAIVRPLLHPPAPYYSLGFFDWSGAAASKPGAVPAVSPVRFEYAFWALLPLLFVPLRSRLIVLAFPGLLEVLASHFATLLVYQSHYSMLWSGYLLAAFAGGAAQLARDRRIFSYAVPIATLATCAAVLQYRDPMARWYYLYRSPDAGDARLTGVLASIPADAGVSGSDEIYAHLAVRPQASRSLDSEYYVADPRIADPTWFSRDKPALDAAVRAGTYRILSRRDGIIVAHRVQ